MKNSYFTEMFYLERKFCTQIMKESKLKDKEKDCKQSEKTY